MEAVGFLAGGLAACAGAASDLPVDLGSERIPASVVKPDGPGPFPAVVILHDCSGSAPVQRSTGPLGSRAADDWTPPAPCRRLAESTRAEPYPVTLVVYPGAHHSFDSDRPVRYVASRVNMNAPGGRGATTGGDPQAWADSISRVVEFFGRISSEPRTE